ncbi:MAG: His/Gly/Thr/Pro-type tRNA ligase C-terminal domain-containing protein, partial [Lentisphaerales bacterium]|nr:His/Gly/Thr/Pro-type tRNA ligase C-terminal domain-containing protein [Lentisphaerales bacterium]
RLPFIVAPVQVAVLPLSKKLSDKTEAIHKKLQKTFRSAHDITQGIGKRYRRQDEIGTPLCVTYDFESEEDNCVTVRDRDTMTQERVSLDELQGYIFNKLNA